MKKKIGEGLLLLTVVLLGVCSANSEPLGRHALKFEGDGPWIETSYSLDFGSEFTVEAWIKPDRLDRWQSYIGLRGQYPYLICVHHRGRAFTGYAYQGEDGMKYSFVFGSLLEADTWIHIALTKENMDDGSAVMRLYINGEKDSELEVNKNYSKLTQNLWISSRVVDRRAFGLIGEIRVWERARAADEISGAMNLELAGDEEGLAGYWKFNEGEGTIAHDSSPNKNHVAISGAEWVEW